MFKSVLDKFKNLEKLTFKIMKNGFKFCFVLSIIACIILMYYMACFQSPSIFYIGFALFKLSLIFAVEFIVCGFSDLIKKQIT